MNDLSSPFFWNRELLDREERYNDCLRRSHDETYVSDYAEQRDDLKLTRLKKMLSQDTNEYRNGLRKALEVYEQELKDVDQDGRPNVRKKLDLVQTELSELYETQTVSFRASTADTIVVKLASGSDVYKLGWYVRDWRGIVVSLLNHSGD